MDFEMMHGGMSHSEWCDYWAGQVQDEIRRVAQAIEQTGIGEAFDRRGKLYRLALSIAPDARTGDIQAMKSWLGAEREGLRGKLTADIAAGTGFLTQELAKWTGTTVYAIDPSVVQLRALLRWCHDEVWAIKASPDRDADIIFSQINEGSLDIVTSFGGLHHVPDHQALWESVARLLKPGGRFIAADVYGHPHNRLRRHFDEVVAEHCLTGHEANWLTVGKLRRLCRGLPLRLVRAEEVPLEWVFDSRREMAIFFQALHAYPLSEEEVARDLERTLGVRKDEQGKVRLRWPMLFFELRKE